MWGLITHPSVRTFSTRTTMKGHCGLHQCLACGGSGGGAGQGTQSGPRTCWGLGGWCFSMCAAGGRPEPGGPPTAQANVGLMRRGDRQHENIILANYSPASLVLSKIL